MLAYTCPFAHMQPSVLEAKGLKNQHSVDKLSHSITISSQLQNFKLRTEIQPTPDLVSCSGQQEVYNTDYNKKPLSWRTSYMGQYHLLLFLKLIH